jgi:plastocyanin
MQIERANVLFSSHVDGAPEVMSFELDVSWNSTSLNASIQTTTPEASPEAMSSNSSIHHVVVDRDEKTVFTPNPLKASVGDTILFTPVNLGDHIVQISLDRPCQAVDSLSAVNFSRLMIPYMVTTEDPVWFYCPSPQQACAPRGKDRGIFSLNPSYRHTVNDGTTTSVAQGDSTSTPKTSSLLRTGNGPAASVLTAVPSLGMWPTSNNTWAMNSSIWATGAPRPGARPSGLSFSGRAANKEVSRGVVSLLITYYYLIGIL